MGKMFQDYLSQSSSRQRLHKLSTMREEEQWLPLSVARDLLCLRLSDEEKIAIIRTVSNKNSLAFEDFMTRNIPDWNQNVGSSALWEWALRSECVLWHRTIPLSYDPHLTQRVSYTLLDLAWFGAGSKVVENFIGWEGLEDMSPAFLSLLFFRAIQWNVESEKFKRIAMKSIQDIYTINAPPERTLPYFLAYLYRYDLKATKKFQFDHRLSGIWTQFHGAVSDEIESGLRINTLTELTGKKLSKANKNKILEALAYDLGASRTSARDHQLDILRTTRKPLSRNQRAELGTILRIPSEKIIAALELSKSTDHFLTALSIVGNLVHVQNRDKVLDLIRDFATKAENPAEFITQLPQKFSTV